MYIDLSSHLKNTLAEDLGSYDYNNSYLRSNLLEDNSSQNVIKKKILINCTYNFYTIDIFYYY